MCFTSTSKKKKENSSRIGHEACTPAAAMPLLEWKYAGLQRSIKAEEEEDDREPRRKGEQKNLGGGRMTNVNRCFLFGGFRQFTRFRFWWSFQFGKVKGPPPPPPPSLPPSFLLLLRESDTTTIQTTNQPLTTSSRRSRRRSRSSVPMASSANNFVCLLMLYMLVL